MRGEGGGVPKAYTRKIPKTHSTVNISVTYNKISSLEQILDIWYISETSLLSWNFRWRSPNELNTFLWPYCRGNLPCKEFVWEVICLRIFLRSNTGSYFCLNIGNSQQAEKLLFLLFSKFIYKVEFVAISYNYLLQILVPLSSSGIFFSAPRSKSWFYETQKCVFIVAKSCVLF